MLVLNNLRVHHLTGLREWLVQRGMEVLFLPPYSPGFTPADSKPSCAKPKRGPAKLWKRPYASLSTGLLTTMLEHGLITAVVTYSVHETAITTGNL
jgi:hypothetical protein